MWRFEVRATRDARRGDVTGHELKSSGWWQLLNAADNPFQPTGKLAVSFALVGSPVHLIPPSLG